MAKLVGGRWYVMDVRTGTLLPYDRRQAWYPTEGQAKQAAH